MLRPSFQRSAAQRGNRARRLVPTQREEHAADQMHHQVAAHSRAVFLPAAPARETSGLKAVFGASLSHVSRSRWRDSSTAGKSTPRLGCCARRSVPPSRRRRSSPRRIARALWRRARSAPPRPYLDNAVVLLRRLHHRKPLRDGMRHRLLAVNVLPRVARIDDDALMPMVGHGRDDFIIPPEEPRPYSAAS